MKRVRVEIAVTALAIVGAVLCWLASTTSTTFGPVDEGVARFVSTTYSGAWVTAAAALVAVAGLFIIDVLVLRRRRDSLRHADTSQG